MQKKLSIIIIFLFLFGIISAPLLHVTDNNCPLFISMNRISSFLPSFIWANITFLGDGLFAFLFLTIFYHSNNKIFVHGFIAGLLTLLLVNLLKSHFGYIRPAGILEHDAFNIIGPILTRRSFPSGHTATIFTLVGVIIFYVQNTKEQIALLLLALLIGFSRIAVGAHWPADVMLGMSIGLLSSSIAYVITRSIKVNFSRTFMIILGILLFATDIYYILFYNSRYPNVYWLQLITGIIFGIKLIYDLKILFSNQKN